MKGNENIKGIVISDHKMKLFPIANDADFLVPDRMSLEVTFLSRTVFHFSLKINFEKSEAFWIGPKRAKDYNFNRTQSILNSTTLSQADFFVNFKG